MTLLDTAYCSEAGSFTATAAQLCFWVVSWWLVGKKPRTAAASERMKPQFLVHLWLCLVWSYTEALEEGTKAEFLFLSMVTSSEYHSSAPAWRIFKLGVGMGPEWICPGWEGRAWDWGTLGSVGPRCPLYYREGTSCYSLSSMGLTLL